MYGLVHCSLSVCACMCASKNCKTLVCCFNPRFYSKPRLTTVPGLVGQVSNLMSLQTNFLVHSIRSLWDPLFLWQCSVIKRIYFDQPEVCSFSYNMSSSALIISFFPHMYSFTISLGAVPRGQAADGVSQIAEGLPELGAIVQDLCRWTTWSFSGGLCRRESREGD